jgi:hypothetical protein
MLDAIQYGAGSGATGGGGDLTHRLHYHLRRGA